MNDKNERLCSLDVLRGLDMMLLSIGGPLIRTAQSSWNCFSPGFMGQIRHGWECFTLWDIIMPLFIFMCGAAIPFALERRLQKGKAVFWKHVLGRVVLLWFMGGLLQGNWAALDPLTFGPYANTLQAIAAGYLAVAAAMSFGSRRLMVVAPIVLAAVYTAALCLGGDYTEVGNFAFRIDQSVFGALLPAGNAYLYHPEVPLADQAHVYYTWIFTSCMFAVMSFCGYHATKIVTSARTKGRKAGLLVVFSAALFAVGFVAEIWIPCIKPIYTLSFTAQAMGWCVLALAALYVVHDILLLRRGLWLVTLFGQCALTIYFTRGFFRGALEAAAHACGDGIASYLPASGRAFFIQLVVLAIVVFLAAMKRRLKIV